MFQIHDDRHESAVYRKQSEYAVVEGEPIVVWPERGEIRAPALVAKDEEDTQINKEMEEAPHMVFHGATDPRERNERCAKYGKKPDERFENGIVAERLYEVCPEGDVL